MNVQSDIAWGLCRGHTKSPCEKRKKKPCWSIMTAVWAGVWTQSSWRAARVRSGKALHKVRSKHSLLSLPTWHPNKRDTTVEGSVSGGPWNRPALALPYARGLWAGSLQGTRGRHGEPRMHHTTDLMHKSWAGHTALHWHEPGTDRAQLKKQHDAGGPEVSIPTLPPPAIYPHRAAESVALCVPM